MNQGLKMMILFNKEGTHETKSQSDFSPETWVESMDNVDGTTGPFWNLEQTDTVKKQIGSECDSESFWAAMNMMHSDYSKVLRTYGVDRPEVYGNLANAFLCDKDSKNGAEKLKAYWEHVVN